MSKEASKNKAVLEGLDSRSCKGYLELMFTNTLLLMRDAGMIDQGDVVHLYGELRSRQKRK